MSHPGDPTPCERCGQVHDPARCQAHSKQTGRQCRRYPTDGQRICRPHGAAAPQAVAAAEQRQVEAEAEQVAHQRIWDVDAAPITDPILALQRFTGRLEVMLDQLGSGINALESLAVDGSHQARVELVAWRFVARELRQALEAMARLGIEDRVTAVLEAQGEQVYELVTAIGRATLAGLVQLLADQPGALEALEAGYERVHEEAARAELGALHELEVGRAS